MHGSFLSDKQKSLDRLNEIRLEACNEGVKNPETKKKLTKKDYMPLKWSIELEKIARIRAMESHLTMEHSRLNKKNIWSVIYDGQKSWGENLAWNFNTANSIDMINQWYEEKHDWVTGGKGVTGHYESIITTRYNYVGLGLFQGSSGKYSMCLAGEFSDQQNLKEEFMDEEINIIQKVDVDKSKIKNYYLECPDIFYIGRKEKIIPRVEINADGICKLWLLSEDQKNLTYSVNDKSIIELNKNSGEIKALKKGKAIISCFKKDKTLFAKKNVEVFTVEEIKKKKIIFNFFGEMIKLQIVHLIVMEFQPKTQ